MPLLLVLLTGCFETRLPVSGDEVPGEYINGSNYIMSLRDGASYIVADDEGKLIDSGIWQLEEDGNRIELRHCAIPSVELCSNFTNGISNRVIGKNREEVVIGNGEPPEDDYRKLLVR